jgi:hypothetical protein
MWSPSAPSPLTGPESTARNMPSRGFASCPYPLGWIIRNGDGARTSERDFSCASTTKFRSVWWYSKLSIIRDGSTPLSARLSGSTHVGGPITTRLSATLAVNAAVPTPASLVSVALPYRSLRRCLLQRLVRRDDLTSQEPSVSRLAPTSPASVRSLSVSPPQAHPEGAKPSAAPYPPLRA